MLTLPNDFALTKSATGGDTTPPPQPLVIAQQQ